MCFIMKTEMLYTRVQCRERESGAVFLFPCCMAAGCSPETERENSGVGRHPGAGFGGSNAFTVNYVHVDTCRGRDRRYARVIAGIGKADAADVESRGQAFCELVLKNYFTG